jgi:DNA polymerase-3 subunit delta'
MVEVDLYERVVGQERAVRHLRAAARSPVHAYLLVGSPGVGVQEAALAFAADLLGGDVRALDGRHPDVTVVERTGASIMVEEIDEVLRLAVRPPREGSRKVLVLHDLHLVDQHYPRLLKTLEEPAPSTVFVVLAEDVPAELSTIASRCVRIDFSPLAAEVVAAALVAEGVDSLRAREVAAAAGGRLDRARLLAGDAGFAARQALWHGVPERLDGTGAAVAVLADELLSSIESVLEPLRARQAAEAAELEERVARYGERGSGRRDLEARHRREQRRVRADELRFGFTTLAAAYRDTLLASAAASSTASPAAADPPSAATAHRHHKQAVAAIEALDAAGEAIVRNPNETLLVQALLCRLTDAAAL